jgi:hypothetical protein
MLAPLKTALVLALLLALLPSSCFGQSNVYSFSVHTRWTVGAYPAQFGLQGYTLNADGSFAYVGASNGGRTTEHTYVILGPKAFSVPFRPLPVAALGVAFVTGLCFLLWRLSARYSVTMALLVFASVLLLTSCASPSSTESASPRSRIIGTWRWVTSDGKRVAGLHYTRYYADSTCAWWPALEPKFSTNGVTYTRYQVDGDVLDLDPKPDSLMFHRYMLLRFKRDTMTVIGEESEREVYERVAPDLEPRQLVPSRTGPMAF